MAEDGTIIPDKQVENRNEKGQFVPGMSGNPNGRPPKEWTWSSLFEDALEEVETDKKTGQKKSLKEWVSRAVIRKAVSGDVFALLTIMNRMEGMPKQAHDLATPDGKKLVIEVIKPNKKTYDGQSTD